MRVKRTSFVISFASTEHAMKMEEYCKAENMPGRIIPTPRAISASCGLAWKCPLESKEELLHAIEKEGLPYEATQDIELWEIE